ncbi:4Fe-4S dicluster domain-containing protein [Clostridium sp. MT-14]|jgi:2-oxoglutarate ferredoxin oxidoreductase subunit delta|uniref:4Fe-4S dicluster domain-containing protein n=1 Tax=Clostridium aromativorans TaxID=2836848 RepID=A0ABS8N684_9CLOT|nr:MULTISPECIES: 4Fe-4S dicluster domain-containing protein [Clostridium]KAA8680579.1 4Fe-4S dicluster domain-containing protein [Clostridium sp. HV4-5-A1G]MCC9295302.1 4Fe-4S dicluster domain-containing protein [Clostridium aromativorans]CAB1261735.1 putative 2-oxoglutarate oxidoreductase, delta subunit [Clostridiaceae bacterium BL-3]
MPKVTFREERCKGCGHCIEVCPKKIVSFSTKLNAKGYHPATVPEDKMEECVACASCARICPDCVITVEK